MKRRQIFTGIGIVVALILLFVFNQLTSKNKTVSLFAEVMSGEFEISLSATGEILAENSIEIKGPEFSTRRDIRSSNIRIQDLVPEGTIVNEGDYIATLDRTELDNDLKDQRERLVSLQANLEMKYLDTAVLHNAYRDGIKNQKYIIEEAEMTYRNSKYEPPTTLRKAEIELDKSQRVLEQRERNYVRVLAQSKTDIFNREYFISLVSRRVKDMEEVLEAFTITAPASGMVIYKRERHGNKRKIGSNDKNIRIEEGLKPGTMVYTTNPENPEEFNLAGEELIPVIKGRAKGKKTEFLQTMQQAENIN